MEEKRTEAKRDEKRRGASLSLYKVVNEISRHARPTDLQILGWYLAVLYRRGEERRGEKRRGEERR